jgi:hypothetical protein
MSFSGVGGGFQGGDALLAFAAIQQGRMNEEMTDSMRVADLRSQMAGDLADIKAHLETADKYGEKFPDVDAEMQAFMAKYGDEPALADVTSTVGEIADGIHRRLGEIASQNTQAQQGHDIDVSEWKSGGMIGSQPPPVVLATFEPNEGTVKNWIDQITQKLDASGTNDQLAMIHIKQLNDNINNSSSMVSGIIESRNNATSSIINNIA